MSGRATAWKIQATRSKPNKRPRVESQPISLINAYVGLRLANAERISRLPYRVDLNCRRKLRPMTRRSGALQHLLPTRWKAKMDESPLGCSNGATWSRRIGGALSGNVDYPTLSLFLTQSG